MNRPDQRDILYELHASICKIFTNPWRLRIVETLGEGELSGSQLVETLGIPKSNLSQHMGMMREKGIVEARREGGYVYYRLSHPNTLKAFRLMREVLMEQMERVGELARTGR